MPNEILDARKEQREIRVVWLLYAVLAYFPLFMNLDVLPLRQWDESRLAVSAYEMVHHGDWLVPHYDGKPDLWSTKPPFLIWCQALLFMLLGPGELALRLPSAICAFLTGAAMVYTGAKWLRKPWLGLLSGLVMCTSDGYVNMHVARSGDYDSMLTFFMFVIALCAFRYERTGSRRAVTGLFMAITMAILTKSVQGLLILPGVGIYFLFTGAWRGFLKERRTWIGLTGTILVVGAYYLGREAVNPGYLNAVWENELGGRYGTTLEGHHGEWDHFIQRFMRWNFSGWYLLVPCGIALGFSLRDMAMRRWTAMLTCTGASYLLVVSSAGTKCDWYDAPLYPVLASLCGLVLHLAFEWLRDARPLDRYLRADATPFIAVFLTFVLPYAHVIDRVYSKAEFSWDAEYFAPMHYMQEAAKGTRELKANVFCFDDYNGPLLFYALLLNEQGKPIRSVAKYDLEPGQRAMAGEPFVRQVIEADYQYRVIDTMGSVRVYEILGRANAQP